MAKGKPRSVEKIILGHNTAGPSSSGGFSGVPHAPVFYPTDDEFKDPLAFISKIRPLAEPFGICRIVPPKSWTPHFALHLPSFTFPTKSQSIHHLQSRPPSCDPETFHLEYNRFLDSHRKSKQRARRAIVFQGGELDLCRLFNAVKRYGGYNKVCEGKRWGDVSRFLLHSDTKISECSKHVLSQLYREHLLDYEEYQCRPVSDNTTVPPKDESLPSHPKRRKKKSNGEKVNVVGLQDSDLGAENGNVPRKEQSLSSDPKRGRKNSNLEKVKEVGLQDSDCGVDNGTVPPKEQSLLSDQKRRRKNSNGEKVKEVDQQDSDRGAENGNISLKEQSLSSDSKRRRKNSNVGKVKEVGLQDSDRGADNGTVPPKEQPLSSYRKRRKKNYNGERVKEADSDQVCQQCRSGLHGEVMLLCDRCDKGWHLYCLSPPLENVPSGNWYCLSCVNSDKDSFGFVPGKRCLIEAFRRMDDRAKKKWLGHSHTTRGQIEKRFWEIVEGRVGEVEVKYGSDLDTSRYGSGFPRVDDPIPLSVEPDVWREYSSNPWNLNNFPKLQGSLLRVVHDNIAGVMVPWLYIGMLFSSFCWHIEDHCFYSINYLHWGEPKCWYGVPGIEANAFEKVMRNTLPDLFDAQPDLLFQLVTMLSPSVLQENGVSVYGVMQEPGNFVITFPRSFHAGFNFGLNCAEAVNFASADWLPHGGFGAELYRLYRKPAVLSHEELLFVVAKNGCDPKVLPYLKEEMSRIFIREKRCREDIWRNGTVRSALLPSKKQPTYVGIEEDSTCIICQQYLYLSAISCSCRPSSLVCLEHSKHLCECKPYKRCLYYRHSLAELGDLVQICSLTSGTTCDLESICSIKSHNKSSTMKKKVKGHYLTYVQLAEDWLLNSCQVLEAPYTNVSYTNALKEAEQFLWADHSMDPVRDMVTKLIEGQKWAQNIRNFLLKVDDFFRCKTNHIDKVSLWQVEELLSIESLSCYEPGYTKLKVYAEEARHLSVEIVSALSARLEIGELERLQAIAVEYPISIEESVILAKEISSAKVLMNRAFDCLSGKNNSITIDFLNKLKSEVLELRVQLPDIGSILNLCREAESWQVRSKEILAGPVKLKELEDFLLGTDNFTVSIPELEVVKQQLSDACSWISQVHKTLQNLKDREDHENIVPELSRILMAGELLRVQVDELSLVEAELRRSRCRERAFKAVSTEMPLGLIKELLTEASLLEIENEDLFIGIFTMLTTATSWEERAKFVLSHGAPLSEFEEVVRSSELITVILPSLPDVKDAVSKAQLWISRSQPYLSCDAHDGDVLCPLRKVDDLKELVSQSKLLKVTLDGSSDSLENILKDVIGWEHTAHSLLEHLKALLNMQETDLVFGNQHKTKLEELLKRIASTTEIGLSLSFELNELASLQHAILTLQWCLKGLSFSFRIPLLEEVDNFLEDADSFPPIFSGNNLAQILVRGSSCLRKALALLHELQTPKRCKLRDIEETLEEIQKILIPYPEMVAQLQNSIEKHNSWIEQVHAFFRLLGQQSWPVLLKLKELGQSVAFDCPELHKVANEGEKVEQWMLQCHAVVEPLVGDLGSLLIELAKIKDMMGRALCIYCGSMGFRASTYCVCCPDESENEKVYTCLTCGDRYHFTCMGPPLANAGMTNEYACPFCLYMESGLISQGGGRTLICKGNRPDLKSFIELLSLSEDLSSDFEERTLVQEIVKQASECKTYLTKIVSKAFSPRDEDLSPISENLLCALKAIAVAGVYDEQDCCKLEAALSRNSWKIRFNKLFRQPKKPALQQVQHLLKEGLAISIPPEDHFMQEITRVKQISLQWADTAKKVFCDAGDLELSEVFKLIIEGEALPVQFEKEMKLLRERSELYCICRKPYDQRAMIACDQCDEWYHFDCINLSQPPPETFFCAACRPTNGEFISLPRPKHNEERSNTDTEPRTPPACRNEPKVRSSRKKTRDSLEKKMDASVDLANILRCNSESDHLWRESRRPLQRTARRRSDYESLSLNFSFSRISSCK